MGPSGYLVCLADLSSGDGRVLRHGRWVFGPGSGVTVGGGSCPFTGFVEEERRAVDGSPRFL